MKKQKIYSAVIKPYGSGMFQDTALRADSKDDAKSKLEEKGHLVQSVTLHSNPNFAARFYNI